MADQTTIPTEPTTRDVLLQIDRRLTRVEDDLRSGHAALLARIEEVGHTLGARIEEVSRALGARIEELNRTLGARIEEVNHTLGEKIEEVSRTLGARTEEVNHTLGEKIDANFRWTVGLIVATWISTIGTVLLK